MRFGIQPVGTVAHEWFMGIAAITDAYEEAGEMALRYWISTFGEGVLGIALTDTFGTPTFLKAFRRPIPESTSASVGASAATSSVPASSTVPAPESLSRTKPPLHAPAGQTGKVKQKTYAHAFTGVRQDSGDPAGFIKMMRDFYDAEGIKDKKTIVFSDSLNIELCLEYMKEAEDAGFQPTFGIGTFLTNDFRNVSSGKKSAPLNIVIKLSSAAGRPAVKISDNIGKNTGDRATVDAVKHRLGYVEKKWDGGDEAQRWGARAGYNDRGYGRGGQGGNPYGQQGGDPYAQQAGNRYDQRPQQPAQQSGVAYPEPAAYGGGQESGRYGGRPANPYAQQDGGGAQQDGGAGGYGGHAAGNNVEMTPMNGAGGQGQSATGYGSDPNAILNECRDLDRGIDTIEQYLGQLRTMQQQSLSDTNASKDSSVNRELERSSRETMEIYRGLVRRVKKLKSQPESGSPKNAPQIGKVDRRLKSAINEYQTVERDFRQKLQAQQARQYRIVRPDATEEEVREAVEGTQQQNIFSQALLQGNRRGEAQSALNAVSDRHEAIQKIEQQMIELSEMFQDLDVLVTQQEAAVVNIDQQGEQVTEDVSKANEEISGAIVKARSRNRKKWWCLLIVVLIIIVIIVVALVAYFVTRNSKNAVTPKYQARLASRPLLTQSITTAVLFATGDVLAQQAVEKVGIEKHSLARTGRMALYGGAIFGPAATTWYKFLQNRIRLPNKNAEILARVAVDQGVFATTNLFVFLSSMSLMEGSDPKEKLQKSYKTALVNNFAVWPAVQAINFKLVPLEHRVLVVNIVSLGWNCYLSYVNSSGGK
ncbi:MAG: nicotinate phosphoribosyltransferase [Thelocarpon impressellum]|nr:MAG: nicotinate phosphoribosyltransferase [Thelocarpon impressellum]